MLIALPLARALLLITATVVAARHAHRVRTRRRLQAVRDVRGVRVRRDGGRVFVRVHDVVRNRLDGAGLSMAATDAIVLWMAASIAVALLASAVALPLGALAFAAALVAGPFATMVLRQRRAQFRVVALPTLLDDVAHHLRGGGTVLTALAEIGESPHVYADACRTAVGRVRAGLTLAGALELWAAETGVAGIGVVAGALVLAAQTGGRAAAALDGLAAGLRDQQAVAAEAHALATQARLSAVVVALAPVGFLVLSATTSPATTRFLTNTATGRACFAVGITLDVVAAQWMRRIVRVEA